MEIKWIPSLSNMVGLIKSTFDILPIAKARGFTLNLGKTSSILQSNKLFLILLFYQFIIKFEKHHLKYRE